MNYKITQTALLFAKQFLKPRIHATLLSFIIVCIGTSAFAQTEVIDKGTAWLKLQQSDDGSFSSGSKQLTDTSEAFHTLWMLNADSEVLSKALNWIKVQPDNGNAANIAWKINTLTHTTADISELLSSLTALQNSDGGFGILKGYKSTPLVTIKALRALIEAKSDNTTAIAKAIDSLANTQKAHGGWTLQEQNKDDLESSDLFITAWVVTVVRQYQVDNNYYPTNASVMITKASAYLEGLQKADNSWGENEKLSSTALALSALIRTTRPQSLNDAVTWLENQQVANGSFSDNVYKTALVLKALRDWAISPVPQPPDLKIEATDITFTPVTPTTTDQIQITGIVNNLGESPASNVQVQFYNGDPANGGTTVGQKFTLASIGGESTGTVRLGLYLPAGTHDLYAKIDPDNIIIEQDESNNIASINISVASTPLSEADLSITSDDITIEVPDALFPNQINITAVIKNLGETIAANVSLQVFDGENKLGNDYILEKVFGQGEYAFQLTATLASGTRNITIKVDPYSQIPELSEDNNEASKEVTVTNLPPATPQNFLIEVGDSAVLLTWSLNTEPDLWGYNVYRDNVKINNSVITANGYLDENLVNGQTYTYKVSAVDLYDAESPFSTELIATPNVALVNKPVITFPASKNITTYANSLQTEIAGVAQAGDLVKIYINNQHRADVSAVAGLSEIETNESFQISLGFLKAIKSKIFDAGSISVWGKLSWNATIISGTSIKFRTRSASLEAELTNAIWSPYYTSSNASIVSKSNRFLQVETLLESNNSNVTPVLQNYKFGSPEGAFLISGVPLVEGENLITAKAVRGTEESAITEPSKVIVTLGVDLAVLNTDLSITPANPTAEQLIEITGIVRNLGLGTAQNINVQYYDGDPELTGIAIGESFTVPVLGASGTANLKLGTYLSAGTHNIYIRIDGENIIPESDKSNNTASIAITVSPAISTPPDFAITASDLNFSNETPTDADTITITAKVTNIGGSTADVLTVALYDGNPANGGTQLGDDIVFPKLTAQSTATVSLSTMLTAGTHTIYAVADPHNIIVEDLENNNSVSKQITVSGTPTASADLVITSSDITFSKVYPIATDIITISGLIKNQGGTSANNVKVRFYDGNPSQGGTQIGAGFVFSGIVPGGEAQANLQTALPEGNHSIYLLIDPANTINETDKLNNIAFKEISVGTAPLSDLVIEVSDIAIPEDEFHAGDRVPVTVTVHNNGIGNANMVGISLYQNTPYLKETQVNRDIPKIPVIFPSESITVTFGWSAEEGNHSLFVVCDPEKVLPEENENNNVASVNLTVLPNASLPPVTDPQIHQAINDGVAWLKTQQHSNGAFGNFGYGSTALALLTLVHAGVPEDDPVVEKGFTYLDNFNGHGYDTYPIAITLMAYQATGNKIKYFNRVQSLVNILHGMHSYGTFPYGCLSNTQYGYLALYAAKQWGISIPENIKTQSIAYLTRWQFSNGSWDYAWGGDPWGGQRGSMTVAGIMGLRIFDVPMDDSRIQNAINWLNSHYSVTTNPGFGSGWHYYYLYGLERAMSMPTYVGKIGEHDWYQDGASFLVTQQNNNGSWTNSNEGSWYHSHSVREVVVTCFALLFLERAIPEASTADLIVENITFSNSNPIQGEIISISASIKNDDIKNIENSFKIRFYDGDPTNGGQQIGTDQEIASLNGESSANVSVSLTIPTSETHTIYVIADAFNSVEEKNENNNTGTAQLTVLTNQGFAITVTTDKQLYNPGETVTADISVTNIGQTTENGNVPVLIKDTSGNTIATLAPEYFEALASGAVHTFNRTWEIDAGTPSGDFRVEASVVQDEQRKAANYATFKVESLYGISAKVTTDRAKYNAHNDISIISKAISETTNYIYSDIKVKIVVTGSSNSEVFSNLYTIDELQPERVNQQKLVWNTGISTPGAYTVTETILENDGTTELASSTAIFTILSSLESGGFAGKISVSPQTVEGPETFDIIYEITNTGNVDITDAQLIKIIDDRQSPEYEYSSSESLTLAIGETYQNTITGVSSADLEVLKYLTVLRLKIAEKEFTVAATYLKIQDTIAPVITNLIPVNGTVTANNQIPISAVVTDSFSGIDETSISLTVDGDVVTSTYAGATGLVSGTPAALADGEHTIVLSVKDKAGNQTTTPEWKITVDATPPVIANMIPANGSISNISTPEISAIVSDTGTGINAATITMTVNGDVVTSAYDSATGKVTYTPATPLTDGWHNIILTVSDNVGNTSTTGEWKIGIDTTPPTIANLTPAPGSIVNENQPEISAILADTFSGIDATTVTLTANGEAVPLVYDAVTGKVTGTPAAQLTDGQYEIVLTVKDNVGNLATSGAWQITIQTYLIFHNATTGKLDFTGTRKTVNGRVHSNADIRIQGSDNDITQMTTAVGDIDIQGSKHDIPEKQDHAPAQPMPVYDMNYYKDNATYTHNGDLHVKKASDLPAGIHYVEGEVRITCNSITANVTIVSTGDMHITGKAPKLTSADAENYLVLFSGGDIKLSGNEAVIKGIIYAPEGDCQITSSGDTIEGAVIADTVDISGSGITFNPRVVE